MTSTRCFIFPHILYSQLFSNISTLTCCFIFSHILYSQKYANASTWTCCFTFPYICILSSFQIFLPHVLYSQIFVNYFHLDSLHLGSFLLTPQSPHLVCDHHHGHIHYDEKDNHSNAYLNDGKAPSPRKIHLMGVFPQDLGTATPSRSSCGCTDDNYT